MTDWRTGLRSDVLKKIESAEARLNDTIQNLMTRWVTKEELPVTFIMRRLDVGQSTVTKLATVFGLDAKLQEIVKVQKATRHRLPKNAFKGSRE